jgi:hypothetical protein
VKKQACQPSPGVAGIVAASGFLVGSLNGDTGDQGKNEQSDVVCGIVESRDAGCEAQLSGSATSVVVVAIGAEDALADDAGFAPAHFFIDKAMRDEEEWFTAERAANGRLQAAELQSEAMKFVKRIEEAIFHGAAL